MERPDYNDRNYEYKQYWNHRDYENASEITALAKLLPAKGRRIIDIGGGFGRLIPSYQDRFDELVIFDQSSKLLSQAEENAKSQNVAIRTCEGDIYKISQYNLGQFDCAVMVRVAHHLDNLDLALSEINKIITPGGILILEFANKLNFKSSLLQLLRLNNDYFKPDPVSRATKSITFLNFHPSFVEKLLKTHGFIVQERLSVSNLRSGTLKKYLPKKLLLTIEDFFQKPFSFLNFGPSVFLKCVKNSG